ncbi:MAG: DNA polymerase I, partial [Notoacmeibacter sp.]|nr:DNA polymerase I [Notoacmeibacter sp.]
MKNGDHLFLVDGSAYIFRAYHALPQLTRKSDGLPVGAVSGFCNMLWKLLRQARDTSVGVTPTHFAVIFDYSSKTFRNEMYPEYKANRSAPPEDLIPQFGLIRQATHAFGLPCIEMEGYEADDIIATYAKLAREAGGDATIISSDKDLMQLVNEKVSMYDPMKDKDIRIPDVIEKWGVGPDKMIDLQALTGDSVDNIPGVPGIGPKTAAQLLEEYGDLDTLLERAGEIKQAKRRENLIENRDKALLSRELVRLKDDVPDLDPLDALTLDEPDGPKLVAYLKAMEFTTLTRRVAEDTGTDAGAVEAATVQTEWGADAHGPDMGSGPDSGKTSAQRTEGGKESVRSPSSAASGDLSPASGESGANTPEGLATARAEAAVASKIDTSAYETVTELSRLKDWIARAREQGLVAFDTETTSLDPMQAELAGFSLALAPGTACYVPLAHKAGAGDLLGGGLVDGQIPVRAALAELKGLLEDASVLKIAQNLKYDLVVMHRHGIDVVSHDDTMLMSYALDAGKGTHGMDALSERWLGHTPIAYKDVCGSGKSAVTFDHVVLDKATAYAAEDADVTLRLWQVLKPRLVADGLITVYERLERPLVPVLARMEERGVSVDRQILSRLSGELAQSAAALEDEISKLAGEDFNPGS